MIAASTHTVHPGGSHQVAKTRGFVNKKQVHFIRKREHLKLHAVQKYIQILDIAHEFEIIHELRIFTLNFT